MAMVSSSFRSSSAPCTSCRDASPAQPCLPRCRRSCWRAAAAGRRRGRPPRRQTTAVAEVARMWARAGNLRRIAWRCTGRCSRACPARTRTLYPRRRPGRSSNARGCRTRSSRTYGAWPTRMPTGGSLFRSSRARCTWSPAAAGASSSPPLCRPSSPPRWRRLRRSRPLHRRPRRRGWLTMVGQLCQVRTMCRVIILSSTAWTYSAPDGWAPTRCRTCSIDPRSPPPTPPASFRCRTPMRMGC
mmetsp:Transcript_30366/g.100789  ORF Transcript_30366/g.100789 Transcript_30366/m.100789 type:complete len:243 (-) Transcript_30366:194-922(-)